MNPSEPRKYRKIAPDYEPAAVPHAVALIDREAPAGRVALG